jgi:hypothetical protein
VQGIGWLLALPWRRRSVVRDAAANPR